MNTYQKISKLQNDKIIYAIESCAITLFIIASLVFLNNQSLLSTSQSQNISTALIIISGLYLIYMGVGNFMRLRKIKELEGSQ